MAIEIDFGRELGRLAFPDDITDEQAQSYVRENYQAIRQGLISRRQEELAAETEVEEKAKFQLGQYDTVETALNTLSELPRGAIEGLGLTAKAAARAATFFPPPTVNPYTGRKIEQTAEVPLEQEPLYRAGQAIQEFGKETYPGLPGVRESLPAQVMGGIGSTVATLPAALIAGPAAPLGAAISYGLQSGESATEDADATINRRISEALANRQYDVAADLQDRREQMKTQAFITAAPIGAATEFFLGAAPKVARRFVTGRIGGIGERLAESLVPKSAKYQRKFLGATGAERVRGAVEALATEGVQESAEQLGGNIAAAAVYDPERGWLDGVAQAGFVGSLSGGIVGGLVGSRRNAKLAGAANEALGGDPTNPLPRANATVAGLEDTQQEGEPEITAEDVLRKSQEAGLPGQEEVVTEPAPKVTPVPAQPQVVVTSVVTPVVTPTPAPTPAPAATVDPETGLAPDEQDELDQLITAEDEGMLSEEGAITLADYRARLGGAQAVVTPVAKAVTPVVRTPAPTPAPVVTTSTKLPKNLAGAKPRYSIFQDTYLPRFDSDFDLAAYIVTQTKKSDSDADYLNWAVERSGMTPEEVRKHGLQVRAELKKLAAKTKAGTAQKPAALVVPSVTIAMPEVKVTATPVSAPVAAPVTPAPTPVAPTPTPAPEYTPARINSLLRKLKAKATAVGKGLYEIKNLAPGQRLVLRTRFGGLQETDQFLLQEKSQVTGYPSDEGFILRDKQEAVAGETPRPAPKPAPIGPKPDDELTEQQYYDARVKEIARDNKATQAEVREQFSREDSNLEHWQAIRNAAESGKQLKVETLNRLPEARIEFLRKQYPQSVPQGYMAPAVSKSVAEKQAEMRAAKRGVRIAPAPAISEEVELNELRISKQQRGRLGRLTEERLQELEKKLAPAPAEPVVAEPTEAELEAAEEARLAQAEEEIDSGPIGQAKQKLEDEGSDMKKSQVKAMARKLEKAGIIDDSELDDEGRDTEVDELVGQLLERVEEARDTAIQEREQELADEARVEKVAPKAAPISKVAQIISKLENLKIDTGGTFDAVLGIPALIWNGALITAQNALRAGKAVTQAIDAAIEYIRTNLNEKQAARVNLDAVREQFETDLVLGRSVSEIIDDGKLRGYKQKARHLIPEERRKLRSDTKKRFVDLFDQLPSVSEFAAAALGGAVKRGWYRKSAEALIDVFGVDAPRFAALLAGLSPQTSVENNLINALNVWKNWNLAGRPTDRAAIVSVMGRSVQGNKGEQSVLDAWINNSVRALSSEDPTSITLSGPKVNSFMLNLRGVVNEVTNDAWMANFALVDQAMFAGSLNATGTDPGKGTGYLAMSAKVRATAEYLTELTGDQWTPAEVQETVWSWAKTLYELQDRRGETRNAVEILRAGDLTEEAIAGTPDFATLLADGEYRRILAEAGYGNQVEQIARRSAELRGAQRAGPASQAAATASQTLRNAEERAARRLVQLRKQRAAEAEAEKAATKTAAQSAIDAIDKVSKGLSENSYSDPLFLTPLAKLALQIAKGLIQVGVAVDKAIRQAIAQARQQFPNDPTDDIQLADRLIRDAEYAEAVAAGDMETAQQMVDEAAVKAGYKTKGFHRTPKAFTKFIPGGPKAEAQFWTTKAGEFRTLFGQSGRAIWFGSSPENLPAYHNEPSGKGVVLEVYLKNPSPLQIDDDTRAWGRDIYADGSKQFPLLLSDEHIQSIRKDGYTGIEYWNNGKTADKSAPDEMVVFDANQIKSADPVTRDDEGNVVPLSQRFQASTADIRGAKLDSVEAILQKVIAATDPKGKVFEAITGLSNFVIYQASKIALRIYQATKSWVAARNAGMDYIKSHVQLSNEAETAANFEEYIKAFPNQEIPAGTPERPQPPSPDVRVPSRGLFLGDISTDTDENWASEAKKWVDFYKGNLERAYQVVLTADIDNAFKEYILGEIIQRNQLDIARGKGDVEVLRALNLEKRLADSAKSLGAVTAKAMAARKLAQERFWWAQPAMILRNLIRKRQDELIPFSKIESEQVRKWLTESGREAVNQIREAMKKADAVFAREFRKIKQVPGEPEGPPIEIKWQDILTKALDTQGSVRQKMLQVILADPRLRNLSPAGIAEITNLLTNAWETKRNQIFRAEFQKKVPLPNVKPDVREKLFRSLPRILKYANIARATPGSFSIQDGPDTYLLWEQAFRDAVAPEFGVAELNGITARKITDLAQKAQAQSGVNRNEIIQQMFRLMAREGGVRFSDVLRDYWYAAVLSGIRTQVDNAMNVFNGFLNTAMFATMAKKDAGFIAYSALKGLDEGIRDFWPMLWRGELYRSVNFNPDQPGSALEGLGESRNLFAKGISQFKYVGRLINALDHMTALMSDSSAKAYALRKLYDADVARQYLTPSPEVVAVARARAIAEGTRPELVNKRTREIIQEKLPVDVLMTSREIREMTTFTETPQGLLGSLYRGLDQAAQGKTLYKVLSGTNFLRFAANSANEILNFALPVALYRYYQSSPGKSEGEYGLKFSESRRDLILAKATFGTALGIFAGALFLGDDDKEEDRNMDITGSFKSLDPNKRKQLLSEGRQPYSIRFGNTYVSYRQMGFGGVLATIGELRDRQLFSPDKWSQENIVDKVLDGAAAGMFIVKDSTAISGLTELLGFANAYKYDTDEFIEKSFPRYVSRLAGSLVPNILKEVDAWSDPSIFKTEAGNLGYEYFLQQVPFGRRDIGPGPILNVLGEPVKVERYPWSRWAKEREVDTAWSTLGSLASKGVFMPVPAITVKVNENGTRRELTREEKYSYQQAVGQGYRKFIEQNRERLLALPPAQASDFIDKNADRIRRNARTNLKNSF